MAKTAEQFDNCFNFLRSETRERMEPNMSFIKAYLTGESNQLNTLTTNWDNGYFIQFLPQLFNHKSSWENSDDRVIEVILELRKIQQSSLSYYVSQITNQMKLKYENEEDAATLMHILNKLQLTAEEKFILLFEGLYYVTGPEKKCENIHTFLKQFTEIHNYQQLKGILGNLINTDFDNRFADLLYKYKNSEFDTYALAKVIHHTYSFNAQTIMYLLQVDPAKYAPIVLNNYISNRPKAIEKRFFDNCLLIVYLIHKHLPKETEALLLKEAYTYLDYFEKEVSNDSNYESRFYDYSNEITSNDYYTALPYSGFSLKLIYDNNPKEGMERLRAHMDLRKSLMVGTLSAFQKSIGNEIIPFAVESLRKDPSKIGREYHTSILNYLTQFDSALYIDHLWGEASHKSKVVRNLIGTHLANYDPNAETKAISLLKDKKAEVRQLAAYVISLAGTQKAIEALKECVDKEGNEEVRDLMLLSLPEQTYHYKSIEEIEERIQTHASRSKSRKVGPDWIKLSELPKLYLINGQEASDEFTSFILLRMSRTKDMRTEPEIKHVFDFVDKEKSMPFASKIINLFFENKAEAKYKYILATGALCGSDEIVNKLKASVESFIEDARVKMAEAAVGALALNGSNKALRWVEFFSRKYRSKKANVGAAALVALESAAEELGISTHELGDRIVPDFGFDGLFKHFKVENDEYRAFVDSNFKIAFFNEDNKKIKSIPAGASEELKAEFKAIAKEIRDVVKSQSPRLEYYLIIQRRWSFAQWKQFFLNNPVMFNYATNLVWGVYSNEDHVVQTFICNDDTSLLNVEQEEIELEDEQNIGIVHPTQISAELLQQWKEVLFDLSIEQVFPQLDRAIPDMSDIDLEKGIIRKFENRHRATGSIRSTLERYGWSKGNTGDGGYLESMNLLNQEKKIEAVLELEGVGVGFGWSGEEKTGKLYVIDKTQVKNRWSLFVQSEDDPKLIKLKDVPTIFLTELLAAIEKIKDFEKS